MVKRVAGCFAAIAVMSTTHAFPADMAIKAPAPASAPIYSWTGFYFGFNGGWGWSRNNVDFTGDGQNNAGNDFISRVFDNVQNFNQITRTLSVDSKGGAIGGGQTGYNWQFASVWLAGLEADIQASGLSGDTTIQSSTRPLQLTAHDNLKWFGTVRGRVDYLATERLLIFGTGGLAFGGTNERADFTSTGFTAVGQNTTIACGASGNCLTGQNSETRAGWAAGGGFEWAFTKTTVPHLTTIKVEYLHVALPDSTLLMTTAGTNATGNGTVTATFHNNFDLLRAGLNFLY
jgi:outer membrane immunogenic protein